MEHGIALQEHMTNDKKELCFTSRQIKGLRKLEDTIEKCRKENLDNIAQELSQIKYILEKNIIALKVETFKDQLLDVKKFIS